MSTIRTAQPMFVLPTARYSAATPARKKARPFKSGAVQALEMFSFGLVLCGLYGLLLAS